MKHLHPVFSSLLLVIIITAHSLYAGPAPGTPVLTPTGLVAIEELKENSFVVSYDPESNTYPLRTINKITQIHAAATYAIKTNSGTIYASANQEFYSLLDNYFLTLDVLAPNTTLLTRHLGLTACVEISLQACATVYDLELDAPHLFFIGHDYLLTHNFVQAVPVVGSVWQAALGLGTAIACLNLKKQASIPGGKTQHVQHRIHEEIKEFCLQYYHKNQLLRKAPDRMQGVKIPSTTPTLAGVSLDDSLYRDMLTFPGRYGPFYPVGTTTSTGDIECTLYVLAFDRWGFNRHPEFTWKEVGKSIVSRTDPLVKAFVQEEDERYFESIKQFVAAYQSTRYLNILKANLWIIQEDKELLSCGFKPWIFQEYEFGLRALRFMIDKQISPWTVIQTINTTPCNPGVDQNLLVSCNSKKSLAIVRDKSTHKILKIAANKSEIDNVDKPDDTPSDIDTLDENKIKHIIEGSKWNNHGWEKLVPDKNWDEIKALIKEVLATGKISKSDDSLFRKVKSIAKHSVEVTYRLQNNMRKIGTVYVQK